MRHKSFLAPISRGRRLATLTAARFCVIQTRIQSDHPQPGYPVIQIKSAFREGADLASTEIKSESGNSRKDTPPIFISRPRELKGIFRRLFDIFQQVPRLAV